MKIHASFKKLQVLCICLVDEIFERVHGASKI